MNLDAAIRDLIRSEIAAALDPSAAQADDVLLVSTTEAGRRLSMGRDSVVSLCETGELDYLEDVPGIRGRAVVVASIHDFIARRQVRRSRRVRAVS